MSGLIVKIKSKLRYFSEWNVSLQRARRAYQR